MFLPVLLTRDFGIWGFVVFAVPNVIGAAAMGWVLRSREHGVRVAERHAQMSTAFSAVTIAFQLFFFASLAFPFGSARPISPAVIAGAPVACVLGVLAAQRVPWGGLLVWLASAGLLIALVSGGSDLATSPKLVSANQNLDVIWLAPVCLFGFALCPYLDATFQRGRVSAPAPRTAFGLGFGVLFLCMILGTLAYAGLALNGDADSQPLAVLAATSPLIIHLTLQLWYTIKVHVDAMPAVWGKRVSVLAVAALTGVLFAVVAPSMSHAGLSGFEVIYRLFMSFYGLLFPAYVWLCMIPARGEQHTQKPKRRKLTVLAAACLLAAPFYWMGFIERDTIWLAPGLGVVLLSRLFVIAAPSPATGGGGPPSGAA